MKHLNKEYGFTLIELLVVIVIIAVLSAVAWPMYKHAVLKSRFSTVMPLAKAVADAQEIYYLGNNQYALEKEDLDVTPVNVEKAEVVLSSLEEEGKYIYVAANRTDIPGTRYIVYQKNSPKFAENIHCEADKSNSEALWLCEKGLSGVELTGGGSLKGADHKTFLLAGNQGDSSFITCPEGVMCDENGRVTQCPDGQTLKEGECVACEISNAVSCSTTEYAATQCQDGYTLKDGVCIRCNIPYSVNCSTTEYAATQCQNGYTLKDGTCIRCNIANAFSCSTTSYEAISCFSGFYVLGGECVRCPGSNVMYCDSAGQPTGCVPGYHVQDGECVRCPGSNVMYCDSAGQPTGCVPGYHVQDGECVRCPGSNAMYCDSSGKTTSCFWSYYLKDGVCVERRSSDGSCVGYGTYCEGSTLAGTASCSDGANCGRYCYRDSYGYRCNSSTTVFTENASCTGMASCAGATFSGNSICTSTRCSDSYSFGTQSLFTDNAVCAGEGCQTANYNENACCAGSSSTCKQGVLKCIYNESTEAYDRVGYW